MWDENQYLTRNNTKESSIFVFISKFKKIMMSNHEMICISIDIFCVNNDERRIGFTYLIWVKTYYELLKFCQPLINSRVVLEKEADRLLLPLQFPQHERWSIHYHRCGAAQSVFYLLRALVLSPSPRIARHVSSRVVRCTCKYIVTRSGVTRRTGAVTNLFAASPRCFATGFALRSVKTCW